jgi:ketosteroid isomerase-like protein
MKVAGAGEILRRDVGEDARFEIEDLIDVEAANAVVFEVRLCGHARHTGIALDVPFSITAWFRDDRIYRSESFSTRSEAFEAAGLSE